MISQGNTEKNPNILLMSPELKSAQNLMPMSESDRSNLKDDIAKNGMRHPVIAYRKEGRYYILAGWNRREIAIELSIPLIEVQIVEGKPEEYKSFVITENLSRRHLSAVQKRELIQYLLKQDHSQSNKSIAKKTGTTKETVKVQRVKLETGGEIRPVETVKGSDGKSYKKQSAYIGLVKKKKIDSPKGAREVLTKSKEIFNLIIFYLNNQIEIMNEQYSKEKINNKPSLRRTKIEARLDVCNEVLEFVKKLEESELDV